MIEEYRCANCRHLLFKGSLKLLLAKKASDDAFIEPKCPRCGKINRFAYHPEHHVKKGEPPSHALFED